MIIYLIMHGLTTSLEAIATVVKAVFTWLIVIVDLDDLTPSMSEFLSIMQTILGISNGRDWFDGLTKGLIVAGLSIVAFLFFINVLKLGFGNIVEVKDSFFQLCVRCVVSIVLILTLATTMESILEFFKDYVYSPSWAQIETSMPDSSYGHAYTRGIVAPFTFDEEIVEDIISPSLDEFADCVNQMICAIISVIFVITIGYQLLKLAFEMVRRYLLTVSLIAISPLTAASFATSATQIILKAYFNMFFGQLILLLLTRVWVKAAISMWYNVSLIELKQSLMMLSWIMIGIKFENYMKTLKMDAPMAGGALLDALSMGAGATMMGISRLGRSAGNLVAGSGSAMQKVGAATDQMGMVRAGNFILGKGTDSKSVLQTAASLPFGASHSNGMTDSFKANMGEAFKRGQLGDIQSKGTFATHLAGMNPDDKQALLKDIVAGQYGNELFGQAGILNADNMYGVDGKSGMETPNLRDMDYHNGNITGVAEMPISINEDGTAKTVDMPFTIGNGATGDTTIPLGDGNTNIAFNKDGRLKEPGLEFTTEYSGDGRISTAELATGTNVANVVEGSPIKDQIPEGTNIVTKMNSDGGADYYIADEAGTPQMRFAATKNANAAPTYSGDTESLYEAINGSYYTSGSPSSPDIAFTSADSMNRIFGDIGLSSVQGISRSEDGSIITVSGLDTNNNVIDYKIQNGLTNNPSLKGPRISTEYGTFQLVKNTPSIKGQDTENHNSKDISFRNATSMDNKGKKNHQNNSSFKDKFTKKNESPKKK